jgi:hypothetical protein
VSKYGLDGFDGNGEPDFALGSVTGVRWWHLQIPGLDLVSVSAGSTWLAGENIAWCSRFSRAAGVLEHDVPDSGCGCGYWAYWDPPAAPNPHDVDVPVLGVVEGYGRTLIGERGFRCAKARIAGLCFAGDEAIRFKEEHRAGRTRARFRTEAAEGTWRALCNRTEYVRPGDDEVNIGLAVLEQMLEDRYGVPVYATRDYLLTRHPPTRDYLPPGNQPVRLPARRVLSGAEALAALHAETEPA